MTRPNYERIRQDSAARSKERSEEGRDIAPLPAVVNPERRAAAERDLEYFLRTYLASSFSLAWSTDHRDVIEALQTALLDGGQFAYAMPRGSGKTTMAMGAALWALLYGHRDFVPLIAADAASAENLLNSIKSQLELKGTLLSEDFPEVCYPIQRLEGIAHRCNGQLCDGERTHISWTNDEIVLPTIAGSKASAGVVRVASITSGIRGMQFTRPDGKTIRPSLAIVDDPQTNESASSPSQVQKRLKTIDGTILGLAGPGVPMACVITCTVIEAGDVADQLLDQQKRPDWQGKRAKMLYALPKDEKKWEEYATIRADGLRAKDKGAAANAFYLANREAMDEGAIVAWPARKLPDELSGVQHAMNLRIKMGADAFDTEYQNDPPKRDLSELAITPEEIIERINHVPRSVVPVEAQHVVAYIDVQGALLYYLVLAVGPGFGSSVIDYGSWPDQGRNYFTLADAKKTLKTDPRYKGMSEEARLYKGAIDLIDHLSSKEWKRAGGGTQRLARGLIDANYGNSTDTVYKVCRESKHAALWLPSHGKFIGAAGKPISHYSRQAGETIGDEWMIPNVKRKRAIRHVLIDANHWKAFAHTRLAAPVGDKSALMLFGDRPDIHRMFADQVARSEFTVRTHGRGREVLEFKQRPNRPDNHLLDCLAGAFVCASMQGVSLMVSPIPATPGKPAARKRRVFNLDV